MFTSACRPLPGQPGRVTGSPLRWGELSPCECWRLGTPPEWGDVHPGINLKFEHFAKDLQKNMATSRYRPGELFRRIHFKMSRETVSLKKMPKKVTELSTLWCPIIMHNN